MAILQRLIWNWSISPRLEELKKQFPEAKIFPTGSRYICNKLSTDIDFIFYCPADQTINLARAGYVKTRNPEYMEQDSADFCSWRKGKVNLIQTYHRPFTNAFIAGTHFCRERQLKFKHERVRVHELFRNAVKKDKDPNLEMYISDTIPNADIVFLKTLCTQHGFAICMAYCAKHGLETV